MPDQHIGYLAGGEMLGEWQLWLFRRIKSRFVPSAAGLPASLKAMQPRDEEDSRYRKVFQAGI
jgi:hypothetical protein